MGPTRWGCNNKQSKESLLLCHGPNLHKRMMDLRSHTNVKNELWLGVGWNRQEINMLSMVNKISQLFS